MRAMVWKAQWQLDYARARGKFVASHAQERQDWIVLLVFNHLFSAMEAYVSAHLIDFPGDLHFEALPGGAPGGVSIGLPLSDAPIGIFDSGIGGLTVARAIHRLLPGESMIYVGDTARVPYGHKSPETVRRYAREILDLLLDHDVKVVVVACNTATAHALDDLGTRTGAGGGRDRTGRARGGGGHRRGRIGVIGTAGTIASGAYGRAIERRRPRCRSPRRPVRCSCRWWRRAGSTMGPPA